MSGLLQSSRSSLSLLPYWYHNNLLSELERASLHVSVSEVHVCFFFKLHTEPSLALSTCPSVTSSAKLNIFSCISYILYICSGTSLISINILSSHTFYRRTSENLKLVIVSIKANGIHSYIKNTEKGSACSHTQEEHDLPCLSLPL